MGRREDSSRRQFRIYRKEGMTYKRATCLHCGKESADNVTKLNSHLEKCEPYQNAIASSSVTQTHFLKRKNVDSVTYITQEDQKLMETKMVDYIFGDGIPLNTVDSSLFRAFTAALNPHFQVPTRKTISNTILDEKYEEAFKAIEKEIQESSSLSLIFDACYTTSNHEKHPIFDEFYIKQLYATFRADLYHYFSIVLYKYGF